MQKGRMPDVAKAKNPKPKIGCVVEQFGDGESPEGKPLASLEGDGMSIQPWWKGLVLEDYFQELFDEGSIFFDPCMKHNDLIPRPIWVNGGCTVCKGPAKLSGLYGYDVYEWPSALGERIPG